MPICASGLHEVITTNSPAVIERLHLVNTSTADGKTHTCFVCFSSHLGPPPGPTILAHVLPLFPFSSFTLTSKGGLGRRSTSLLSGEMVSNEKVLKFWEHKMESKLAAKVPGGQTKSLVLAKSKMGVPKKLKYSVDPANSIEKHQHLTISSQIVRGS